MAKNQSLPAHLQEKDSRGEENLILYEHHEKLTIWWPRPSLSNPRSTNEIVWAFLRANPTLLGSLWIVSLQLLFKYHLHINVARELVVEYLMRW